MNAVRIKIIILADQSLLFYERSQKIYIRHCRCNRVRFYFKQILIILVNILHFQFHDGSHLLLMIVETKSNHTSLLFRFLTRCIISVRVYDFMHSLA